MGALRAPPKLSGVEPKRYLMSTSAFTCTCTEVYVHLNIFTIIHIHLHITYTCIKISQINLKGTSPPYVAQNQRRDDLC